MIADDIRLPDKAREADDLTQEEARMLMIVAKLYDPVENPILVRCKRKLLRKAYT